MERDASPVCSLRGSAALLSVSGAMQVRADISCVRCEPASTTEVVPACSSSVVVLRILQQGLNEHAELVAAEEQYTVKFQNQSLLLERLHFLYQFLCLQHC